MPTATWEHGGSPLYTQLGIFPSTVGVGSFGSGTSTPDIAVQTAAWDATGNENGDTGTVNFTADGGFAFFSTISISFQLFDDGSFTGTDAINTIRIVFDWQLTNGPMGTATARSAFNTSVDGTDDVHGPGIQTGTYDKSITGTDFGTPTIADLFAVVAIGGIAAMGVNSTFYYEAGTFSANDRRLAISNLQVIVDYGASAPVVTDVNPNRGDAAGNTVVTLTGTGFTGATTATFGDTAVPFNPISDTSGNCVSPAHAVGAVTVSVA